LKNLRNLIDQLISWGDTTFDNHQYHERILTTQLIDLYKSFLLAEETFTNQVFPDPPETSVEEMKEKIKKNFPSWGYYNQILNPVDQLGRPDFGMGDAVDDLAELIKELKGLKWRFEHNCIKDSLWHFRFIFDNHLSLLIINLLRYMEVKKQREKV
jgi:hypothetical protein